MYFMKTALLIDKHYHIDLIVLCTIPTVRTRFLVRFAPEDVPLPFGTKPSAATFLARYYRDTCFNIHGDVL